MQPVMYIVLNKGAGMSPGKLAAQAAHAAVEAFILSPDDNTKRVWHRGGHYTKIVLEARDAEHLRSIERYIADRGFATALIIDEGRTEVLPHTPTALGVQIVDKHDAHVAATFSTFDLYKELRLPDEVRDLEMGEQVMVSRAGDQLVPGTVRKTEDFDPAIGGSKLVTLVPCPPAPAPPSSGTTWIRTPPIGTTVFTTTIGDRSEPFKFSRNYDRLYG